jgi:hypothetical protein
MKNLSFKGTKEEARREEAWARDTDLVAKMSAVQAEARFPSHFSRSCTNNHILPFIPCAEIYDSKHTLFGVWKPWSYICNSSVFQMFCNRHCSNLFLLF